MTSPTLKKIYVSLFKEAIVGFPAYINKDDGRYTSILSNEGYLPIGRHVPANLLVVGRENEVWILEKDENGSSERPYKYMSIGDPEVVDKIRAFLELHLGAPRGNNA